MKTLHECIEGIGSEWKDPHFWEKIDKNPFFTSSGINSPKKYLDRVRTITLNYALISTYLPELLSGGFKVWDFSCGSGIFLEILRFMGNYVEGSDQPGLPYRMLTESQGINVSVIDGRKPPFPIKSKSVHWLTCIGALTFYGGENWEKVMREFFRIAQKGVFIGINAGGIYDENKKIIEKMVLPPKWHLTKRNRTYFKYERI